MRFRLVTALAAACLSTSLAAQAPNIPNLTRPQRDLLKTVVFAVDAALAQPETDDALLRTHLLRASDGSHYVAFTVTPPASWRMPAGASVLYVRLASAHSLSAQQPERSLVREWLTTNQVAPPPSLLANRGLALGEMPIMGATATIEKRPPQTAEMASLTLMDLERRRAREREDERERQRKAGLEGRGAPVMDTLPFEDFQVAAAPKVIQRALTAGPGDYFLFIGTADSEAANPDSTTRVIKKRLTLPAATATELTIGSVILADRIETRAAAYPPAEQASHPYALGLNEIVPSGDASFTDQENVSVVFQVINPKAAADGKPNVDVLYQIVRLANNQETPVASLTPQSYSADKLPAEFDLRVGHPLFVTVTAPLASLKHGSYRLKILVNDKLAGHTATADTDFTVSATAATLLRDAPPLGLPFRREAVFGAEALASILTTLKPPAASPALQRALDLAAAGRFADLLVEEPVPAEEEAIRTALRGLAQLGVGDGSAAVQFQRAQLLGAPLPMMRFLAGAARAMQSRDADAIAAWQEAMTAGAPRELVIPQLLDAYLRRGDAARAAAVLGDAKSTRWSRSTAATLIANRKEAEAILMLDARLVESPADIDAQWLLIHALFSQLVRNGAAPAVSERFSAQARAYVAAKGPNAATAEEWLAAISSL